MRTGKAGEAPPHERGDTDTRGSRGSAPRVSEVAGGESPGPAGLPPPPPPPPPPTLAPASRLTATAAAAGCPAAAAAERLLEAAWPRRAASGRRRHPTAPRTGGHGPAACARAPPRSAHAPAPPAAPPRVGARARPGGSGMRVLRGKRRVSGWKTRFQAEEFGWGGCAPRSSVLSLGAAPRWAPSRQTVTLCFPPSSRRGRDLGLNSDGRAGGWGWFWVLPGRGGPVGAAAASLEGDSQESSGKIGGSVWADA